MTQTIDLGQALVANLRQHLQVSPKAKGFDRLVRERVAACAPLDPAALGSAVEDILRGVQDELEADHLCKQRKHFHRAWVKAIATGCLERGSSPEQVLPPLAHMALLVSYDEGIMLPVFAYSVGWGAGQAWAVVSRNEVDRARYVELIQQGIRSGLSRLKADEPELDPELIDTDERILEAADSGFSAAALISLVKNPF